MGFSEHKEYSSNKDEWSKCKDFTHSEKAIKDAGDKYLPKLTEQEAEEYDSYKERTPIMLFAQRALKVMTGMSIRKPATINKEFEKFIESADKEKNNFDLYLFKIIDNFLITGRCATLVEMDAVAPGTTVEAAEAAGIRPYFAYYDEEAIFDWHVTDGELDYIALKETEVEFNEETFETEEVTKFRVLDTFLGYYRQRIFDDNKKQIGVDIVPRVGGNTMKTIPIVIHGGIPVNPSPLNAIIDLNKAHYQLSADEIHGLRCAALPTPYFLGEDPEDDNFPRHIGPSRMLGHSDENCKIGYLEFTGKGLEAVANKLEKIEAYIVMLSVQMATDDIEQTATETALDYSNATASLSGVIHLLNKDFKILFGYVADWMRISREKVSVKLNMDFMPITLSSQDIMALVYAYLKQTISYETLFKNLAKGEITNINKGHDTEMDEILAEMPEALKFELEKGEKSGDTDVTGDSGMDNNLK